MAQKKHTLEELREKAKAVSSETAKTIRGGFQDVPPHPITGSYGAFPWLEIDIRKPFDRPTGQAGHTGEIPRIFP